MTAMKKYSTDKENNEMFFHWKEYQFAPWAMLIWVTIHVELVQDQSKAMLVWVGHIKNMKWQMTKWHYGYPK